MLNETDGFNFRFKFQGSSCNLAEGQGEQEMKPCISIVALDRGDNELTATIEIEVDTDSQAIELWQYLRQQADKWIENKLAK